MGIFCTVSTRHRVLVSVSWLSGFLVFGITINASRIKLQVPSQVTQKSITTRPRLLHTRTRRRTSTSTRNLVTDPMSVRPRLFRADVMLDA